MRSRSFCLAILVLAFFASARAATFTVTNTASSGPGSLRQAILDANLTMELDTVVFNVNGGGFQTILTGDLPRLTYPIILDATTQPGYAGAPLIEITGAGGSGITSGFTIDGGGSTIRGFVINNYNLGGIAIFTKDGNTIEGNYIGTSGTGMQPKPNLDAGIRIFDSSNNVIGGNTPAKRNLISANAGAGISMNGTDASNNVIIGNYIGTNILGTIAQDVIMRNGREGVCLCGTNPGFFVTGNRIGGTAPGEGNLISANTFDEIRLSGKASENVVQGNLIGTNAAGTAALHRNGNGGNGIMIDGATNNLIGGSAPGARNIISGQVFGPSGGGHGIRIEFGVGNVIKGNYIGTDVTGTQPLPNSEHGISAFEAVRGTMIGGVSPGEGNLIAFNTRSGIVISTSTVTSVSTNGNTIRGNSVHSNGELGIDLTTNIGSGPTPNDPCDEDIGPRIVNDLQNFPVLNFAGTDGTTVNIRGTLDSLPNASFTLDFYGSPAADPTGFGEGKVYLGSANVATGPGCTAAFSAFLPAVPEGQWITATATGAGGSTSEFSQAINMVPAVLPRTAFDYDGDGRADLSVRRPSDNVWYLLRATAGYTAQQFGVAGDRMVPADYDGDRKTDVAVFRPSNGTWYVFMSQSQTFQAFGWGQDGDIPVPTDRDADGKADLVIYRPSNNTWYTRLSNGTFNTFQFGVAGDKPMLGDFDGDGVGDVALFRPSNNNWYIIKSSLGFFVQTWGEPGDLPLAADFDGDGATDQAVFRPSTGQWFLSRTSAGFASQNWGANGDVPVPADYDGDGKADVAVFRSSTGTWHIAQSSAGILIQQFGQTGDVPTPSSFSY